MTLAINPVSTVYYNSKKKKDRNLNNAFKDIRCSKIFTIYIFIYTYIEIRKYGAFWDDRFNCSTQENILSSIVHICGGFRWQGHLPNWRKNIHLDRFRRTVSHVLNWKTKIMTSPPPIWNPRSSPACFFFLVWNCKKTMIYAI